MPVVVIKNLDDTEKILAALKKDGINCAEITFRTACAKEAIALAVEKFPDMNVGAGTVINGRQCVEALNAGAKFIVSSGSASATDEWAFIIWKQAQTSFRVRSSMTVPTWLSHRKSPAMWIGKRSSKAWIGSTLRVLRLRFPNPQWSCLLSPSRKRRSGTSPFLATSTTARISRSTARRPVRSCGSLPSMSMWRLPTRKMYKSRLKSPSMSTSDSTSSTARNMCAWQ